jgi:hypothetical protein
MRAGFASVQVTIQQTRRYRVYFISTCLATEGNPYEKLRMHDLVAKSSQFALTYVAAF